MPSPEKQTYRIGRDGLPARLSGQWARRKHHYLRNYCGITTKSMRSKFRLVYLDVMAGPGLCIEETSGEELPGSPFVALDHEFSQYYFIEGDERMHTALAARLATHEKRDRISIQRGNWIDIVEAGELRFDASTLVVAFIDPTGVADLPIATLRRLMENPRIDLLLTIQYRLGIVWNAPQYGRAETDDVALTQFLGHSRWRDWRPHDASELGRMAVDDFCQQIHDAGINGARHISVPETNPLYRFALFSRSLEGHAPSCPKSRGRRWRGAGARPRLRTASAHGSVGHDRACPSKVPFRAHDLDAIAVSAALTSELVSRTPIHP